MSNAPHGLGTSRHPRQWLEQNEDTVRKAAFGVASRRRLQRDDRDELLSSLWCHLLKDDYRALRSYRGASAIGTYLSKVAERVLLDLRVSERGKWRPSPEAKRLGPHGVMFERMVTRDQECPSWALAATRRATGLAVPEEFASVTARRGPRRGRRFVGLEGIDLVAPDDPWRLLAQGHARQRRTALSRALRVVLAQLPVEDRTLVRLRHDCGLRVSGIARQRSDCQRRLYGRFEAIYARLRGELVRRGINAADVEALLDGAATPGNPPVVYRQSPAATSPAQ
jgi:DNA-directed RNA polymerase specialized sigma24 family protein